MNLKIKIKILILTIAGVCIGATFSNAAIEIKPGTSPHTNVTMNTTYSYCYNMRAFGSSLGANSLDPHLSTTADWGAAAYLGLSGYGYVRSKEGQTITIGDVSYYSTTKNATGVMNMGNKETQVAQIIDNYNSEFDSDLALAKTTKYVTNLKSNNEENILGLALNETKGWFSSRSDYENYTNSRYYSVPNRTGVIGYTTYVAGYSAAGGVANSNVTYRPVIWN